MRSLISTGIHTFPRGGQALILIVVMMGGILFTVTAVAGLLMYYQLQQSNDAANSTVAIFAADAGIERALYYYFFEHTPSGCASYPCTASAPAPSLVNGATAENIRLVIPDPLDVNGIAVISANGKDAGRRTIRALETSFLLKSY
ncbi:MAG: hypothetical protein HYU81_01050 [Candidatus Brennerbacteria bacterium]|nr:hypothetical protein [Candidatus Brennerbacteria bacterium]